MEHRMAKAGIVLPQIQLNLSQKTPGYDEFSYQYGQLPVTDDGTTADGYLRPTEMADHMNLERTPDSAEDYATEIVPDFLYLGSDDVASNLDELQSHDITHILNMSRECRNHFEPIPTERPFMYLKADLADNPFEDFYNFIPRGIHFVESAFDELLRGNKAAVLVHCWAGRSRSPCMVVAYLMYKHGIRLDAAIDLVKSKRADANTSTFLDQLRDFEFYLARSGHFELADACRARDEAFLPRPIPVQISPPATQRPLGSGGQQSKSLQQLSLFSAPTPQDGMLLGNLSDQHIQEQLLISGHTHTATPGDTAPGQLTVIHRMTPDERQRHSLVTKGKVTAEYGSENTVQTQAQTRKQSDAHIAKLVNSGVGAGGKPQAAPVPLRKDAEQGCCIVM